MNKKKISYFIAVDECGDVFIFTEKPELFDESQGAFWSCRGEEEKLYNAKDETETPLGQILEDFWVDIADNMNWQDEPKEIILTSE